MNKLFKSLDANLTLVLFSATFISALTSLNLVENSHTASAVCFLFLTVVFGITSLASLKNDVEAGRFTAIFEF